MKNDNTIFWIIGIAILIFLILPKLQVQEQEEFITLGVHYYDKDMNEIFPLTSTSPTVPFSIVAPRESILETIDPSLLDDEAGFVIREDIEHNFENGLPDNPEEDIEDVPSTRINFWKNLIYQIGTFGIVTTTKTVRIDAYNTNTYCEDKVDGSYEFDKYMLNDIGSDEITGGVEVCNALMQFPVTGLSADLTSTAQITSVTLWYKTGTIYSDEGNGASTDFCVIDDIEEIDTTPNDEGEREDMYEMLEKCSGGGDYICEFQNCGSDIDLAALYTYRFEETEEQRWFSREISSLSGWVKNEIINNKDGSPSPYLSIGIEGEYDTNDDERVDFYDEDDADRPYIVIKYTVTTCVPDTCSSLGKQCGTWSDGCGGTLNCGVCETGYICSDGQCIPEPVYISFEVIATNPLTSEIDYTGVSITNATPSELKNALPIVSYDLPVGSIQTWYSDNIAIKSEWEGITQTFEVWVGGTNEYTELIETKYASTDLNL